PPTGFATSRPCRPDQGCAVASASPRPRMCRPTVCGCTIAWSSKAVGARRASPRSSACTTTEGKAHHASIDDVISAVDIEHAAGDQLGAVERKKRGRFPDVVDTDKA